MEDQALGGPLPGLVGGCRPAGWGWGGSTPVVGLLAGPQDKAASSTPPNQRPKRVQSRKPHSDISTRCHGHRGQSWPSEGHTVPGAHTRRWDPWSLESWSLAASRCPLSSEGCALHSCRPEF